MNINLINELKNKEFKVLDKGFVRLIDVMGDDAAIVQAARVSYGEGTKTVREDRGLIRYLMRHRHTSPFEMVEFKFHVKLPIFVARQWIRHRTANVNEYSGRYSVIRDEFYVPEIEEIRTQSQVNKQGRSEENISEELAREVAKKIEATQSKLYQEYEEFLNLNVARELSRINLPLSTYTEWYWKIDLHNLFHFLKLRLDKTAQFEIRKYAEIMADIVKQIVPLSYEAFEDYILNSITFSKSELLYLKNLISGITNISEESLLINGFSKTESREFIEKLKIFNSL
ncbi:MAG: FAD-dependent thymidylate synthase [Candidatus Kapabacteria bacterium]|nr:FAD-dependent thymidylate synthase [Candidatus Kapabacteria bacterium]